MFRFNQKKVNKEVDELKKLLAITKGMRTPAKSISSSFLKEDVNPLSQTAADPLSQTAADPLSQTAADPANAPTPEKVAETDAQEAFEEATNDSKVTEMSDSIVKAEKYEGKLKFTYDVDKKNPTFESDELELDEDTIKTLQKVLAYFGIWKGKTEKKPT